MPEDYESRQDALADIARSMVAPSAPRGSLDYSDWVGDD